MNRWIIIVLILLFVDFYAFQGIKTVTKNKFIYILYWVISIGIYANLIYKLFPFDNSNDYTRGVMLAFGLLLLSFVPKFITFIFLFGEDIFRVLKGGVDVVFNDGINTSSFLAVEEPLLVKWL